MMKAFLACVICAASSAAAAQGRFVDGNELKIICDGTGPQCTLYIQGAADAMSFARGYLGQSGCLPTGVNSRQIVDATKKYLEDNPAIRTMNGAAIVALAVYKNWGCDPMPEKPSGR